MMCAQPGSFIRSLFETLAEYGGALIGPRDVSIETTDPDWLIAAVVFAIVTDDDTKRID